MKFLIVSLFFISFSGLAFAQEGDDVLPAKILQHINQYRLKQGLPALQMIAAISAEAKEHSQDMANHRLGFGHDFFNIRIKKIYATLPHCRGGAENIAYNYRNARHVVSEWIKSPGHRRNIEGRYNLTGIGVARDNHGKLYFTQLFIRN